MEVTESKDNENNEDNLSRLSGLAEPNRRLLYDFIVSQNDYVSREQAAQASGLRKGIASHHLDRLVQDGLLEVVFKNLPGNNGGKVGRPSKLYRRATNEIEVSLPSREYKIAAQILAKAVDSTLSRKCTLDEAITDSAHEEGKKIAEQLRVTIKNEESIDRQIIGGLSQYGYEPETLYDGVTVLHNCPFHAIAQEHKELICSMNHTMLDSMLKEIDQTKLVAKLEPQAQHCCVRLYGNCEKIKEKN